MSDSNTHSTDPSADAAAVEPQGDVIGAGAAGNTTEKDPSQWVTGTSR